MPRKHPRNIPLDDLVRHSDRWSTSVNWPAPIDMRLDGLVRAAVEAGEGDGLSRAEMLSALVLAAEANGETLGQLLRAYRVAKVRVAIVSAGQGPGTDENVIALPTRKPGRR